jgi:hypothetical protein
MRGLVSAWQTLSIQADFSSRDREFRAAERKNPMNSKRLVIASFFLFGSLWGLAELGLGRLATHGAIPRAPLLTACAVFFLVLFRRVWNEPGSSLLLGSLAASFKFLSNPVFGCQIGAVLILAGTFDLFFSFSRQHLDRQEIGAFDRGKSRLGVLARAAATAFVSFVVFGVFARYLLADPHWVAGGVSKLIRFQFLEGILAAVLALPACLIALGTAPQVLSAPDSWDTKGWLVYRLAALGSGTAGVVLALALRY